MLQKNSFFSQPLIFFGPHQINEEEEVADEDTWHLTDPWFIADNASNPAPQIPHIGLFIHWADAADRE